MHRVQSEVGPVAIEDEAEPSRTVGHPAEQFSCGYIPETLRAGAEAASPTGIPENG
jgi:hypothetical protein